MGASGESVRGYGRAKRAAGGTASLPPEASQVVAEGDGLRVMDNIQLYNVSKILVGTN